MKTLIAVPKSEIDKRQAEHASKESSRNGRLRKMKIRKNRNIVYTVLLLIGAWFGQFTVLTTAETKMEAAEIPPVPQEIRADVFTRDRDLLKVTSNWPKSLTVENISDKEVSGFTIEIFADNDDGGPGEIVQWGVMPWQGEYTQTPLFKPRESMFLPIKPETVKKFRDNDKPFLYIQLASVGINNDSNYMYTYGALMQRDPSNPKRYIVIADAKGRSKH